MTQRRQEAERDPSMVEPLMRCMGCGALVAHVEGPTHRYVGASPGCWAIFGEVLAREYGEPAYAAAHRLTVDAYSAQHPGVPSPQSIQSVNLHLISLYLVLERGKAPAEATAVIQRAARRKDRFMWLEPPAFLGAVTVLDVHNARDAAEHKARVRCWAGSVWDAWAPHHGTARHWAQEWLSES